MESFGETLVHIRKGRGLTQTDIARRMTDLGFSVSTNAVCKWETNYSKPSVLQFFGYVKYLVFMILILLSMWQKNQIRMIS